MNAIKNYSSSIPINRIFEKLQQTLARHGAQQITFDYGRDGKIYGVVFSVAIGPQKIWVKLPARVDKAHAILKSQYQQGLIRDRKVLDPDQAYRVAWRNIYDWVEAQMALLDIEMARIEEVFLPYMTNDNGQTLFEVFEKTGFQLPAAPEEGKVQ